MQAASIRILNEKKRSHTEVGGCGLGYVQGEPAETKLRSGQLHESQRRRMEQRVYTFFVDQTLRTNYQQQSFEGCPIQ